VIEQADTHDSAADDYDLRMRINDNLLVRLFGSNHYREDGSLRSFEFFDDSRNDFMQVSDHPIIRV
jgi:hypothetical protein